MAVPALIDVLDARAQAVPRSELAASALRKQAARALGQIGPQARDAVPSLRKALEDPDEAVRSEAKVALKKIFGSMNEVALPVGPWEDAASLVVQVESAASFRSLIRSGKIAELTDPLGQISGYLNEQYSAADYQQALKVREILQKKMDAIFESFDVLVAPSQPVPATPLTLNLETGLSFPDPLGAIGNLCGLPALSVPCGFTEKNLPIGLEFLAGAGDDIAAIQAARTFQQHTDWHKRHPRIH